MKLALAGGGTGGHIYPGIALTEELMRQEKDSEVLFLTSVRSNFGLPDGVAGCRWVRIGASPAPEKFRRWPQALRKNLSGYRKSRSALKRFEPEILLGLGGYASVPPLLAALRSGIPFFLHEQNTVPGRVNLFFARWARRVALGFPLAGDFFPTSKTVLTGNPITVRVRKGGIGPREKNQPPGQNCFTLLVMGGSRGASYINQLFRAGSGHLKKSGNPLRIIHITGKEDEKEIRKAYQKVGITARVLSFLDDMGRAYRQADLAVVRGGAITLTELAYWRLPSLIIPYPTAKGRHQLLNARYFEKNGAALVFEQNKFDASDLMRTILDLSNDEMRLKIMSEKCRDLFIPGAGRAILKLLREEIEKNN